MPHTNNELTCDIFHSLARQGYYYFVLWQVSGVYYFYYAPLAFSLTNVQAVRRSVTDYSTACCHDRWGKSWRIWNVNNLISD